MHHFGIICVFSEAAIAKAHNWARIRIANYMILLTILASVGCVISGKNAASRGESVQNANLEWHRKYNQQESTPEAAK